MDLFLALTLVAALPTAVGPTGVELERLIDSTVQLPGTTGPIGFDGPVPVPCGQGVLFWAFEPGMGQSWGYYVTSNGVGVFVDEETIVPGSTQSFQGVARSEFRCLGGRRYLFPGYGENLPVSVYEGYPGGQINLIQSGGVTVGGHDFGHFQEVGASHYGVGIFSQLDPLSLGEALMVKPFAGDPIFVAAEGETIMPGQSQPTDNLNRPRMMGSDLFFRARTPPLFGFFLYRWSEGSGFSVVVNEQTPVPGVAATFTGVGQFTALAGGIAFAGGYSGGVGIFLYDQGGQLEPLVLPGQTTVGGATIQAAFNPTGAGGLMAFRGWTEEMGQFKPSVFARTSDGQIYRILGQGDVIEDQTVLFINGSADDRSVAVHIDYVEDQVWYSVIYRANFATTVDIPTLSSFGFVVSILALLLGGLWALRRTRAFV